MASSIKINPNTMQDLYETLRKGSLHTTGMIQALISYKRVLEEQGISESSLSLIVSYCDSLISMMEVMESSQTALQNHASEITASFMHADLNLADSYGGSSPAKQSYQEYKDQKYKEEHMTDSYYD
ncbi:hypothetical protein [Peribacillus kribbensis]|uniref:hypothetical protein n=1 Tax=Peribacillus kribbensis TaxID=356658 RepID=UPI0004296A75|nr:hypothetical protein [Peribacillus kribbensis]